MSIYQSTYTGPQIDEAIGKVSTIEQSVINNTEDITTIEETLGTIEGSIGDVATDLGTHTSDGTIHHTVEELNGVYEPKNSNIQSHISDETIHHTVEEIGTALGNTFEPKKGSDDNYVTDAEKILISNTSGTNTGDETASTIKNKLGITTLSGSNTGDQDLSGLQLKNIIVNNTSILTGDWVADTTYSGYGYKVVITINGVTSSMLAEVTLGHIESISGNYSPICVTGTNSVTVYSKVNTGITIPTILIQK